MKESILTSTFLHVRDRLRSMAAGIVGNADDAEDVLHDAFCKLWLSHPEVAGETEAAKLSYTTVRNTAIDSFRRSRAHLSSSLEMIPEPLSDMDSDEEIERKTVCEALLKLSRRVLPDRQYKVFILHDVEGLPYPEIAEQLALSQDNVRTILSRARKAIREEYRKRRNH